jgi:hypothetical protein
MKTTSGITLCMLSSLLLASCATPSSGTKNDTAAAAPSATRVKKAPTCFLSNKTGSVPSDAEAFGAVLLSAILPALIDKGLEFSGKALREAGKEKKTTVESKLPLDFYAYSGEPDTDLVLNLHPEMRCLVVTKGRFGGRRSFSAKYNDEQKSHFDDLGLTADPEFYLELSMDISSDRSSFLLTPVYLIYDSYVDEEARSGQRQVVVTTSFTKPGGAQPFAIFAHDLGKLSPGQPNAAIGTSEAKWMTLPAISEDNEKAVATQAAAVSRYKTLKRRKTAKEVQLERAKNELADYEIAQAKDGTVKRTLQIAKLEREVAAEAQAAADQALLRRTRWGLPGLEPVTVSVFIEETRDARETLLFLADVLDGSKDKIGAATLAAIDPLKREEAKKARATAEVTKQESVRARESAVVQAQFDYLIKQELYQQTEARAGATTVEKLTAKKEMELARKVLEDANARLNLALMQ